MLGMTLTIANTAGVVVGQIYTTETGPRYKKGLAISLGLASVALVAVGTLMTGMWYANKKRAQKIQAAIDAGSPLPEEPWKGDYDVYFKYSL